MRQLTRQLTLRLQEFRTADRGSILPLTLAFFALALTVILLASLAASLYLERKKLFTLADGASLVAAESFSLDSLQLGGDGTARPLLNDTEVRAAALGYLQRLAPSEAEFWQLEYAGTPDGLSAVVELSGYWRPDIITFFVPEGVKITVIAKARSIFSY